MLLRAANSGVIDAPYQFAPTHLLFAGAGLAVILLGLVLLLSGILNFGDSKILGLFLMTMAVTTCVGGGAVAVTVPQQMSRDMHVVDALATEGIDLPHGDLYYGAASEDTNVGVRDGEPVVVALIRDGKTVQWKVVK